MASIIALDVKFSATPEKHYLCIVPFTMNRCHPPRKSRLLLCFPSLDTDEKMMHSGRVLGTGENGEKQNTMGMDKTNSSKPHLMFEIMGPDDGE